MAYTYNLSTTVRGGKRAIWDSVWDGSGAEDERRAGLTGTSTYHQCSMIFDTSALSGKTITGINLTFTVVSGTIPGHGTNNFPICYKADSSTTSWKRSSTSAVGYIKNQTSGGGSYGASNTSMTVNMGTTLPSYGYVAGSIKSPSGSYKNVVLGSSATLAVTTNETYREYTLAYNANGGSGAPGTMSVGNIQVNPSCAFTVSSVKPTRSSVSAGSYTVSYSGGGSLSNSTAARTTSYTFSSWNTNSAGTGTNYAPGSTFTSTSTSNTLYAKWSASTSTASVTLPNPTMTGYSFNGWWTANTGGTKVGVGGAAYTPTGNVTLYARWTPNTYTVSYNMNGGTGSIASQTKTYGVNLTLSSTKPTRASTSAGSYTVTYNANGGTVGSASASATRTTSYAFSKWNTASNGSGTSYESGGTYATNAAATLYAQWNSSTSTAAVTLPTPARTGYNFTGWYTATSGGSKAGNAGASYTPSGNITLYAQWSAASASLSTVTDPVACDGAANNFKATWSPVSNCRYKITVTCGNATAVSSAVTAANASEAYVTIPTTWYSMSNGPMKNSETATATCTLTTYQNDGVTAIGTSSKTFTVSVPTGVKPTLGTLSKSSSSDNGKVASWGTSVFVQGYSKVTLTLSVSDLHGASGVSKVRFYGPGIDQTVSSTTSPASAVITSAGTLTYYADCYDTRNRKSTTSTTVTFHAYAQPTVSWIEVGRSDKNGNDNNSSGAWIKFKPKFSYSSCGGHNQLSTHTAQYTLHGSSAVLGSLTCTSGTTYAPINAEATPPTGTIWPVSATNAYDVSVILVDSIQANAGTNTTLTTILPSVQGIWFGKGNDRLGLGGVPTGPGLHVDWNAEFNGVLDVTQRRCYGTLSSAGWHRVFRCGWASGSAIKISIGVNASEFHDIDLIFNTGTSFEFACEVSKGSSSLLIDKIRAWVDQSNNYVYIDLHQSVSASFHIIVEFAPKGDIVRRELLGVSYAIMQTYDFTYVGDSPAVGSLAAEHSFVPNNTPVAAQEPSSLLTSGTIAASGSLNYTATQPCWAYLMFVMQANSTGFINIKVNNIDIVNWLSGEAIPVNFAFLPIPLMTGDTLYVEQSSNRASSYKIFAMR